MITVLLVDDHPALRAGVRRSIEADPDLAVVGEAGDGHTAVRLALDLRPDVIVLDVDLPGLSGPDVARALRDEPARIIAFTAHTGRGFVQALAEAGVSGYVTKDQEDHVLIDAVKAVARGEGRWFVVPHDPTDPVSALTARERELLVHLAQGLSNPDIARALFVSESTVRNALTVVFQKLNVATSREAIAWAWAQGLGERTP